MPMLKDDPPPLPVGARVRKFSGKPFKSREKVNTVAGYVTSPVTNRPCYTFAEDDSFVEMRACEENKD